MSVGTMLLQLGKGMISTTEIFFLTLLFSLPLGLFISFGRMSKNGLLRGISKFYISIMWYTTNASAISGVLCALLFIWIKFKRVSFFCHHSCLFH